MATDERKTGQDGIPSINGFSLEENEIRLRISELMEFEAQSRAILRDWIPETRLNGGAYAHVFRMRKRESQRRAALKFIPIPFKRDECVADPEAFKSEFDEQKREVELLAQFRDYPYIMQMIGEPEFLTASIQKNGQKVIRYAVLFLMPLLNAKDIWGPQIKDSVSDRLRLCIQMSTALIAFNEKKIRHRDIKPENILMDEHGNFFLTDLGQAKRGNQTTTFRLRGTEGYIAPEVYKAWEREEAFDHRADIYSLGIVMYELFNWGQKPFLERNGTLSKDSIRAYHSIYRLKRESLPAGECASQLRYSGKIKLPPPGEVDSELASIILKACAYEAKDRYRNAGFLLDALETYRRHHPECAERGTIRVHEAQEVLVAPAQDGGGKKGARPAAIVLTILAFTGICVGVWILAPDSEQDERPAPAIELTATPSSDLAVLPTLEVMETPTIEPTATPTIEPTATPTAVPYRTEDGFEAVELEDGTLAITGYTGSGVMISIPQKIEGKRVTTIGMKAFSGCWSLRQVTIPKSVTVIESRAFSGCPALIRVIFPNSIEKIHSFAFANRSYSLTFVVPAGSYAEKYARIFGIHYEIADSSSNTKKFKVKDLETAELEDGTLAITGYKGGAAVIKLPEKIDGKKVTAIGSRAFEDCTSITEVTIPDSVTTIEDRAFYDCWSLTRIAIPDSVKSIGRRAFYRCWSLEQIAIPDSVLSFGSDLFSGCTSLTEVRLTYLDKDENWFIGCSNLKTIIRPEGAEPCSIENGFCICDDSLIAYLGNEEAVRVPDSVKKIGGHAFEDCVSLKQVMLPESVTEIGRYAFSNCSRLTRISLPDAVAKIGNQAFYGCTSLMELQLPKALTDLEGNPFAGCTNLETLHIPEEASRYSFENGCLIADDKLEAYIGNETTVTVPESVKSIDNNAFENCTLLERVVLPESMTEIGGFAFFFCESLKQVVLPESVSRIGEGAFSCCLSLEQITLPKAVTMINGWAFESCETLKQFTIPDSVTQIGIYAFRNCTSLERIEIPSSVTSIDSRAFEDCSESLTLVVPAGSYAETYAKEKGITCETR